MKTTKLVTIIENGISLYFYDNEARQAVKTYGLLKDAGYYANLHWTRGLGFNLTAGIKPK